MTYEKHTPEYSFKKHLAAKERGDDEAAELWFKVAIRGQCIKLFGQRGRNQTPRA